MRASVSSVVLLAAWLGSAAVRAETCPDVPDDEVALRRSMAKEWFAKAEESETSGDRQAAVRRYACSLNLAPHPSTAYNLGTVAEKSGDLSMAVDGFRSYLKLATEATDRPAIEARIVALEAKISELRRITPKPTTEPGAATAAVTPPAPPAVVAKPPALPPENPGHGPKVLAWTSAGVGAAALGAGIGLNLWARSKMSQCNSQYYAHVDHALERCDEAKPLAYGSYAAFGVAGALGVASAMLFLSTTGGSAPEETAPPTGVAFVRGLIPVVTAGGGGLLATGRF